MGKDSFLIEGLELIHLYVSLMLSEMVFLTRSMGMGLKLPPFINPNCG